MITRAEQERRSELYEKGLKECSKCQKTLPIDRFRPNKRGWKGLRSWCRGCQNEATLDYQKRNPEVLAGRQQRWRNANPERAHEVAKRYRDTHPLEERLRAGRYRAEQLGLPAHDIKPDELLADWRRRGIDPDHCVYTGEPLQDAWNIDHMVPLSHPASPGHVVSNLVPTNRSINASKGSRHFVEYLADRAEGITA